MTSRDFCFWLQGFLELAQTNAVGNGTNDVSMSTGQIECVRKHLSLVFKHEIDPSMGGAKLQAVLNDIHNPIPGPGPTMRC